MGCNIIALDGRIKDAKRIIFGTKPPFCAVFGKLSCYGDGEELPSPAKIIHIILLVAKENKKNGDPMSCATNFSFCVSSCHDFLQISLLALQTAPSYHAS